MDKSVHLLAIQTILDGEYQPPASYARLIKKYFIEKEVLRSNVAERTLAEELFEEEEKPEKPEERPRARTADDRETNDDARAIRRALYRTVPPTPEEAEASYNSLLKAFKLSPGNPEREMMGRVSKPLSYGGPDRITPSGGLPPNFVDRLNRIKFLIYRGAGIKADKANEISKINPFKSSRTLQEDTVRTPVLNLNDFKGNSLNEGMLGMFGAWIEYALKGMFGGWGSNLKVLGSKRDLEAFAKTIGGEARYIQAAKKYGLDHPTTYKNKSSLEVAVRNFEKETGIQWPFK